MCYLEVYFITFSYLSIIDFYFNFNAVWEHSLCDCHSFKFFSGMFYDPEHILCWWLCHASLRRIRVLLFCMTYPVDISQTQLTDVALQFNYILIAFLPTLSVNEKERCVEEMDKRHEKQTFHQREYTDGKARCWTSLAFTETLYKLISKYDAITHLSKWIMWK